MSYRYAPDDEDCEGKPVAAICDDCGEDLDPDIWQDCEIPHHSRAPEHACEYCRYLGNKEREEFERTHARGHL